MQFHRLAVMLVDAKLPDMDGLDVAGRVRGADPGVPVIMVSGYFYQDDPDIQAALAEGLICGFVEKPVCARCDHWGHGSRAMLPGGCLGG